MCVIAALKDCSGFREYINKKNISFTQCCYHYFSRVAGSTYNLFDAYTIDIFFVHKYRRVAEHHLTLTTSVEY